MVDLFFISRYVCVSHPEDHIFQREGVANLEGRVRVRICTSRSMLNTNLKVVN